MAKKTEHNVLTQEPVEEEKKAPKDLSKELAASLERLPGDIVKCTRVGTDRYRCNWMAPEVNPKYDNPGMAGLAITTHRIRMSRFMRVTGTDASDLNIEVLSGAPTKPRF